MQSARANNLLHMAAARHTGNTVDADPLACQAAGGDAKSEDGSPPEGLFSDEEFCSATGVITGDDEDCDDLPDLGPFLLEDDCCSANGIITDEEDIELELDSGTTSNDGEGFLHIPDDKCDPGGAFTSSSTYYEAYVVQIAAHPNCNQKLAALSDATPTEEMCKWISDSELMGKMPHHYQAINHAARNEPIDAEGYALGVAIRSYKNGSKARSEERSEDSPTDSLKLLAGSEEVNKVEVARLRDEAEMLGKKVKVVPFKYHVAAMLDINIRMRMFSSGAHVIVDLNTRLPGLMTYHPKLLPNGTVIEGAWSQVVFRDSKCGFCFPLLVEMLLGRIVTARKKDRKPLLFSVHCIRTTYGINCNAIVSVGGVQATKMQHLQHRSVYGTPLSETPVCVVCSIKWIMQRGEFLRLNCSGGTAEKRTAERSGFCVRHGKCGQPMDWGKTPFRSEADARKWLLNGVQKKRKQ